MARGPQGVFQFGQRRQRSRQRDIPVAVVPGQGNLGEAWLCEPGGDGVSGAGHRGHASLMTDLALQAAAVGNHGHRLS